MTMEGHLCITVESTRTLWLQASQLRTAKLRQMKSFSRSWTTEKMEDVDIT